MFWLRPSDTSVPTDARGRRILIWLIFFCASLAAIQGPAQVLAFQGKAIKCLGWIAGIAIMGILATAATYCTEWFIDLFAGILLGQAEQREDRPDLAEQLDHIRKLRSEGRRDEAWVEVETLRTTYPEDPDVLREVARCSLEQDRSTSPEHSEGDR